MSVIIKKTINTNTNTKCSQCGKPFHIKPSRAKKSTNHFCSKGCHNNHMKGTSRSHIEIKCDWCNEPFLRRKKLVAGKNINLCSYECSGFYKGTIKKKGHQRSRFEQYIEDNIFNDYPFLYIKFNDRDVIGSELDIYIETLNIAFEINGPYHYLPIRGYDKLNKIIKRDIIKQCSCLKNDIVLHIIDVSKQKTSDFQSDYCNIKNIINLCLQHNPVDINIKAPKPVSKVVKNNTKKCSFCKKDTTNLKYCSEKCRNDDKRKTSPLGNIPKEDIIAKLNELGNNYTQTGKYFGVSDNAIRKRLKSK